MDNTAIFYGSSTGNTETAAKQIAAMLNADIFDVADNPSDKLNAYVNLIFGTSTWGMGELQDDWDVFITKVKKADLNGKVIAIFGFGDSGSYPDSFADGIGIIYQAIQDKGCKIVGFTETAGYEYDGSVAEIDGKFVGLPLDEENQSELTDERLDSWVKQIKTEFNH